MKFLLYVITQHHIHVHLDAEMLTIFITILRNYYDSGNCDSRVFLGI